MRFRTIRCEHDVYEAMIGIGDIPRFDDALAALSEAFARHPEQYPVLVEAGVRIAPLNLVPPIRVAFVVTDDEIRVLTLSLDDRGARVRVPTG
jgi:hypothetical protein